MTPCCHFKFSKRPKSGTKGVFPEHFGPTTKISKLLCLFPFFLEREKRTRKQRLFRLCGKQSIEEGQQTTHGFPQRRQGGTNQFAGRGGGRAWVPSKQNNPSKKRLEKRWVFFPSLPSHRRRDAATLKCENGDSALLWFFWIFTLIGFLKEKRGKTRFSLKIILCKRASDRER